MLKNNSWLEEGIFFIGLFLLCGLIFSPFIPEMGFYWDDLTYSWFNVMEGPAGTARAYAMDRPVLASVYYLSMSLMNTSPISWQFLSLLFRYLLCLSFYFFQSAIWPNHKLEARVITAFLLVYPGFQQQWIAITYFHQFLIFSIYLLSLILSLKLILRPKFFSSLLAVSLLLQGLCLLAMEHLFGLELLRPVLFFFVLRRVQDKENKDSFLRTTFFRWLPYAVINIIFIIYRTFVSQSVLNSVIQLDNLRLYPLQTVLDFISTQFRNAYICAVQAWWLMGSVFKNFSMNKLHFEQKGLLFAGILLSSGAILFSLYRQKKTVDFKNQKSGTQYFSELLIICALSLFFAGTPFWAAGHNVRLHFPNNRFLLLFAIGASYFIFLPLYFLHRRKSIFSVLVCTLILLASNFHLDSAEEFVRDWADFQDFITQLTWRAPEIQENTLLIAEEIPLRFYSDNSLTAAINWTYADEIPSGELPYLLNYTTTRLGGSLPSLQANTPVKHPYRIYTFSGSTNQMIVLKYTPGRCLHVAVPGIDDNNPSFSPLLQEAIAFSQIGAIIGEVQEYPALFVNKQNENNWCFFYQKAALAMQAEDDSKIIRLGEEAFSLGLAASDPREYLPFIYGYAQAGDWRKVRDLANTIVLKQPEYQRMVCAFLKSRLVQNSLDDQSLSSIANLLEELSCGTFSPINNPR